MTKAIFVALFLAMFLGAPALMRDETTQLSDDNNGSAVTLFMDATDASSSLVPMDATDNSEFNQVIAFMKMRVTPATVACGSTNDDALSATVNFGEDPYSDAMSTQKDEVGTTTRHLICHRTGMDNMTGNLNTTTANGTMSDGGTQVAIELLFEPSQLTAQKAAIIITSTAETVRSPGITVALIGMFGVGSLGQNFSTMSTTFGITKAQQQAPAWATIVEGVAISALPVRDVAYIHDHDVLDDAQFGGSALWA